MEFDFFDILQPDNATWCIFESRTVSNIYAHGSDTESSNRFI